MHTHCLLSRTQQVAQYLLRSRALPPLHVLVGDDQTLLSPLLSFLPLSRDLWSSFLPGRVAVFTVDARSVSSVGAVLLRIVAGVLPVHRPHFVLCCDSAGIG